MTAQDDDASYMRKIKAIDKSWKEFEPDLVIYNAGTNVLAGDPMAGLNISEKGIIERDEYIFELALLKYQTPIVMLLSGGFEE